jgi:hypothetical protein
MLAGARLAPGLSTRWRIRKYVMRIHELLAGHALLETEADDPGLGSSTPLATMAAPGAAAVNQGEFKLAGLKPLRRLKSLKRGGLTASSSIDE